MAVSSFPANAYQRFLRALLPLADRIAESPLEAYVLLVAEDRHSVLLDAVDRGQQRVSEAVPRTGIGQKPLVVFASFRKGHITHFAAGRRGAPAATGAVRLHLLALQELTTDRSFVDLVSAVPARVRNHLQAYFRSGGRLPPASRDALIDVMARTDPRVAEHLRLRQSDSGLIQGLSPRARTNLGNQKDAVNVALRAAGIEPQELASWRAPSTFDSTEHRFFLEGLSARRMWEDDMILHDASVIPGFRQIRKTSPVIARFQGKMRPANRMTVIMANKRPLELQTGTDLIYFNEEYKSFVMVQYKAMDAAEGERRFRWQEGDQLTKELGRMKRTLVDIEQAPRGTAPVDYRLSANPFFLKFCTRGGFLPGTTDLYPGLYLPLDLWDCLHKAGKFRGPRGGNVLTYDVTQRWLSNTEFLNLLTKAWIGTTSGQSSVLRAIIASVVESNRTVVYAFKHAPGPGE